MLEAGTQQEMHKGFVRSGDGDRTPDAGSR